MRHTRPRSKQAAELMEHPDVEHAQASRGQALPFDVSLVGSEEAPKRGHVRRLHLVRLAPEGNVRLPPIRTRWVITHRDFGPHEFPGARRLCEIALTVGPSTLRSGQMERAVIELDLNRLGVGSFVLGRPTAPKGHADSLAPRFIAVVLVAQSGSSGQVRLSGRSGRA
jgi:hypothetical protein